jgi:hypothetical protein
LLALSSALCVALGDVLQQRATHRLTDTSASNLALFAKLCGDRRWRWGAARLVVSIALQAGALDRGSVLLVQALLVLSLLFALPISARFAHRGVTGREWVWAAVLTAAVIVIVTVGNPQPGQSRASLGTWDALLFVKVGREAHGENFSRPPFLVADCGRRSSGVKVGSSRWRCGDSTLTPPRSRHRGARNEEWRWPGLDRPLPSTH